MAEISGVQVFVRKSSGLTRQISAWDALMYCAMNPGLLFSMVYIIWTPYLYPGVYMPLAVLSVLAIFPIAALYWFLSVAMPRSGGEYVYISRILHPALGLMASFVLSVTAISWTGILTDWWLKWSLADVFRGVALLNHNQHLAAIADFFDQSAVRAIIGTISLIVTGYVFMKGARWMMRISWITVFVAAAGVALWLVAVAIGRSSFAANWTAITGVPYDQILEAAKAGKYTLDFTFQATLMGGITYVVLNALGSTFSANMAGEIRGVEKSQMLALFGSLIIQMVLWYLFYWGSYVLQGAQWTNALMWAFNAGDKSYPWDGHEPFATLIVGVATRSPFFVVCIAIAFFVACWASAAGLGFAPTRNLFAWAFDRLLPAKYSEIDRRTRSPLWVIWTTIAVAWIFLMMDIYLPTWTSDIAYTITAWFVAWIILGLAGILFPITRRQLFEQAPPLVKSRFLGVPIVSILGLLTFAVSAYVEYAMLLPYFQGSLPYTFLVMTLIFMLIPLAMYGVASLYHGRRGVPLQQQFAAIPPE